MNNRIVEDAIEVHTPNGIRMIAMPAECSVARVGAMVLHLMECAGYEPTKPERGAAFAFAPKVYEDEVAETPFDSDADPLPIPMSMIPGTRITRCVNTGSGYYGRIYQYSPRKLYEFRLREFDPGYRLRPAGGE